MVMWNLKTMEPEAKFSPCRARHWRIRWALPEGQNWAITAAGTDLATVACQARRSWVLAGEGRRDDRADPAKVPLPVDISITADAKGFVGEHLHGRHPRIISISPTPEHPRQTYAKQQSAAQGEHGVAELGRAPRFYMTSSLLSKWDKTGKDNEQFPACIPLGRS